MGVVLGSVLLWLFDGRCRLFRPWSPWSPLPLPSSFRFFFVALVVSASPWPVAWLFPGGGGGCTVGRVVAFSPCVVGYCGGIRWPWACFFPFRDVRRLDLVRPTVSVPCLVAVVCFGVAVLCCAVLCCAVPRCSALCCAPPCSAVPCRAVSCRVVPCRGVVGRALLCPSAPCRAVLCRVAGCRAALRCTVVCSAVVCSAVSCGAVLCCALLCGGSIVPLAQLGAASVPVRLVALLCGSRAQVKWLAGGRWALFGVVRLAGSVLRGVWVSRPVWWVRRVSVGLPSLGACALVPCPLGVPVPRGASGSAGWGCVVLSALLVPLPAHGMAAPAIGRSTPLPRLQQGATPPIPRTVSASPPCPRQGGPRGPPPPGTATRPVPPAATDAAPLCRRSMEIGDSPPPPVPGGTTRGPPGPADAS